MYNSVATEEGESDRETYSAADKLGKPAYLEPKDTIQGRELPELPASPESGGL